MTSLSSAVKTTISQALTSPALRQLSRQSHALRRRLSRQPATVHYFHQVDDPYSHLTALHLEAFEAKYRVRLVPHLVPPPDAAAAPEPLKLQNWSALDAKRLARSLGLNVPDFLRQPKHNEIEAAQSALAQVLEQARWAPKLAAISDALWRGTDLSGAGKGQNPADAGLLAHQMLESGAALRHQWGHYLGATFYFEGEWYWGLDRLHHLEQRLGQAGLASANTALLPLVPARAPVFKPIEPTSPARPVIYFYCSLRSPYTYLAAAQLRRLAEHYGAELRLCFVLPMMMRGLPVNWPKRLYILRDTKREAERLGLPFGRIVDPLHNATERGLALLHLAIPLGRGPALLESFLQGVFADGLDAASEAGLLTIAERAGLNPSQVDSALADPAWRDQASAHLQDMLARGLWGVPSFRVDNMPAVWGQDRLWMLEEDLIAALSPPVSQTA